MKWRNMFVVRFGRGCLPCRELARNRQAGFTLPRHGSSNRPRGKGSALKLRLKIECDKYQNGPWYAVLMGQSGLTTPDCRALYDELNAIRQILKRPDSDNEESCSTRPWCLVVTFGEEWEIPVADLEALQEIRAGKWPSTRCLSRNLSQRTWHKSVRPPLQWELELMEGCPACRALISSSDTSQDDPAKEHDDVSHRVRRKLR